MTGYEPVPTLPELAKRGLAEVVERSKKTSEPTHYRATPEGQALIDATMRRNAEWGRLNPEASTERFNQAVRDAKAAGGTKKK